MRYKYIKISDSDYRALWWLGSDAWMVAKGSKPLDAEEVLHRIIEKECREADPPQYQSTVGRGD